MRVLDTRLPFRCTEAGTLECFSSKWKPPCLGGRSVFRRILRHVASQGARGQASATGLTWACIVFALMYLWGGVHFMLAARTLRRDMAQAPPEDAAVA